MQAVVDVVLPVFALILVGFLAGRLGVLGQDAMQGLNKFVYAFALPALFFVGMARVPVAAVLDPAFVAAFVGGAAIAAAAVVAAARLAFRGTAGETAMGAFVGGFSNSGYMGIPFFAAAFGAAGHLPVIVASVLNGTVVFGTAAIALELTRNRGAGIVRASTEAVRATLVNPLIAAMALGMAWSALGLGMPRAAGIFFDLLGACAGPCALFAIGLFLAGRDAGALLDPARAAETLWITAVKLVVQPVATFAIGAQLGLAPFALAAVTICAAFPVGATAFVLAQRHGVYVERCSAIILLSTALSLPSLSLAMILLDPQP
jgi:predicted permease